MTHCYAYLGQVKDLSDSSTLVVLSLKSSVIVYTFMYHLKQTAEITKLSQVSLEGLYKMIQKSLENIESSEKSYKDEEVDYIILKNIYTEYQFDSSFYTNIYFQMSIKMTGSTR